MDISIVITYYYQEDTILNAVDSFLKQDVNLKEIVIVDDGASMCERVKNGILMREKVKLFQIEHKGVSGARNYGIQNAVSEFVFIADGDDTYAPTLIGKLYKMLKEDTELAGVTSWLKLSRGENYILEAQGGGVESFLCLNGCPGQLMLKKETWESVGGYDENMVEGYEDWEFYIRLTKNGKKIGVYPEALINYSCPKRKADIEYLRRRIKWKKYVVNKHIDLYSRDIVKVIEIMEKLFFQRIQSIQVEKLTVQLGDGSIEALNNEENKEGIKK